jgi:hypothetical protein
VGQFGWVAIPLTNPTDVVVAVPFSSSEPAILGLNSRRSLVVTRLEGSSQP